MAHKRLSLKELPEEERPREKLIQHGEMSLSDAELLGIILGSGTRTESAVQLAQQILKKAGDLKTLASMSVSELQEGFHGIGPARAAQLKAALELARRLKESEEPSLPRFSNSRAVFQHFKDYFHGRQQEEFWVAVLDAKNKLIRKALVTKGTLMGSMVHPREVFFPAIKSLGAGIIAVHNHPSGDPEPSPEDLKVTRQIAEAGKLLGIPLFDHIIIGRTNYYSFKDAGLL
jgi:DNA repair protein RadC